MADILIVEDDELIAVSLERALRTVGHRGLVEGSIAGGRRRVCEAALVLCDLGLPDGDGLDLIAEIAACCPRLPVIALTARAEQADIVAGLGGGAIDYVTKPFVLAELLARIDAQLRRVAAFDAERREQPIRVGDLEIDPGAHRVLAGEPLELRPREYDLLWRLAVDAGTALARDVLMRDVWGTGWFGSPKTLDVHINALRRKLGDARGAPRRIVTVRGVGYRLETE